MHSSRKQRECFASISAPNLNKGEVAGGAVVSISSGNRYEILVQCTVESLHAATLLGHTPSILAPSGKYHVCISQGKFGIHVARVNNDQTHKQFGEMHNTIQYFFLKEIRNPDEVLEPVVQT